MESTGKTASEEKSRNQRLKTTYGITLDEYNSLLTYQGGGCAICGKPPITKRLAVDHDHKFRYYKIIVTKENGLFKVYIPRLKMSTTFHATRKDAYAYARYLAKRASVRGLLCFRCNTALRKFGDDATLMSSAASYITRHRTRILNEEKDSQPS